MENLIGMIVERFLDPLVVVPGIAASAALASGIAARVVERWEVRRARRSPRPA